MAALDFPSSPTVGQQYTAPNGAIYTWDGAAWTVSGVLSTGTAAGGDLSGTYPNPTVTPAAKSKWTDTGTALTPVDATKRVAIPGPTTGSDQSVLTWGTRTMKGRLYSLPGVDWIGYTLNSRWDGTVFNQDDPTKSGWLSYISGDIWTLGRTPPGSTSVTTMLALDNAGVPSFTGNRIWFGPSPRAGFEAYQGSLAMHANNAWGPDAPASPSWTAYCRPDTDQFAIYRRAPNAAAGTVTAPLIINGPDGKTTCSLADGSVTKPMIAASHTVYVMTSGAFPAGTTINTVGTWIRVVDCANITVRAAPVLITLSAGWKYTGSNTANQIYLGVGKNYANPFVASKYEYLASGTSFTQWPLPGPSWWDNPTAGAYVYSLWIYIGNNAGSVSTSPDSPGYMYATQFS
jgi:hypothetical protein